MSNIFFSVFMYIIEVLNNFGICNFKGFQAFIDSRKNEFIWTN